MSTKGGWGARVWVTLIAAVLLSSSLGFGGGFRYAEATLPTANGVWSGDWFREAYGWFASALHLDYTTANSVLITNSGKNATTDADFKWVAANNTLIVPNILVTNSTKTSQSYVKEYYGNRFYDVIVTVADNGANYTKLSTALAAITDATATKRYCINVIGNITETSVIEGKSYIDVNGFGAVIDSNSDLVYDAVLIESVVYSVWRDLTIYRRGNPTTISSGLVVNGTTDSTFQMFNCVIDNDCTGTDHHYGCQIMDSASPIITNCKFDGGDASYGYAVICWDSSTPKFQTCTLTGGTGGNSNWGVATHDTTAPIFTNCIISGGSGTSSHGFSSAVNATPILDNCIITVTSSGTGVFVWNSALLKVSGGVITGGGAGISVTDTAIIEITGSIIKGGATGTDFAALNIGSPNLSKVTGCIIIGGTGGAQNYGVQTYYSAAPIITGCTILGGSNGANCYGIYTTYSSSPTISGSTIRSGAKGANSYAVYMKDNSSPNIIGASVYGGVNINGYSHSYTSANNGRFQPYATDAYLITGISVLVNNAAGAGTTLSLGNSIGGTEIASGIAIDSTGLKNFAFTRTEQAAAGYLYATASAGIADGSVTIYYDVTTNYADCWGVYVNTRGYGRIEGTTITSNGASNTVYIVDTAEAANAWKISNCHIETLDATNQKTVACQSAYVGVPIYKSTFIGPFTNVSGLAQDNSGTSSIASGTTSITFAHGLGETPLASWFTITFTENPTNTPGACWVTANATHTIVNVENDPGASNLDFGWKAIKP